MAVGWIDNVFNNTDTTWFLKSVDDRNNGVLKSGSASLQLDDAQFHEIKPKTQYGADWCGIPWYFQGKHYKALSRDQKSGIAFFTSEIGAENWIIYNDIATGRPIARQSAPKGSDFHCNLRFEDEGIFLDIVNNNAFSGENAVYQVYSETKEWVKVLLPAITAAIKAAA
jgi:hypothetical protein